jgi:hypothetical protein
MQAISSISKSNGTNFRRIIAHCFWRLENITTFLLMLRVLVFNHMLEIFHHEKVMFHMEILPLILNFPTISIYIISIKELTYKIVFYIRIVLQILCRILQLQCKKILNSSIIIKNTLNIDKLVLFLEHLFE